MRMMNNGNAQWGDVCGRLSFAFSDGEKEIDVMKKSKIAVSAILSVAFIWFTTHFGGGFASGAQLYSYFGKYGGWCLILPILAMAYDALFFGYALYFARKHQVYDYRSYNNVFHGRFAPVFSNLFEIIYLVTMCLAPAVAFATGGATLKTVTGLSYPVCTVIIGVFIFIVAIFGSKLVRKVAFVLSIMIIVGLLTLVQKAYSFLAYLEIPVILIPYIIHMIVTRFDTKERR